MAIGKTLSTLLSEKGITRSELAKRVGVTASTINSIIDRDNSGIKITLLNDICKELEVSPELFFEDFANRPQAISTFTGSEREHIKKYRTLDEYGKKAIDDLLLTEYQRCTADTQPKKIIHLPKSVLKASAGTGNWLDEQQLESVSALATPQSERANLIIEVDGDSMYPMFHNGDSVLVSTSDEVAVGDVGIFILDGCGFIKKLADDRLVSVNPNYEDIYPNEYSDLRCVGKVLGKAEIVK